jgi:hypothetical protein
LRQICEYGNLYEHKQIAFLQGMDIRRTASDSLCVRLISQVVFGAFEAVHEPSGSSGPYKLVKLVTIHPRNGRLRMLECASHDRFYQRSNRNHEGFQHRRIVLH